MLKMTRRGSWWIGVTEPTHNQPSYQVSVSGRAFHMAADHPTATIANVMNPQWWLDNYIVRDEKKHRYDLPHMGIIIVKKLSAKRAAAQRDFLALLADLKHMSVGIVETENQATFCWVTTLEPERRSA